MEYESQLCRMTQQEIILKDDKSEFHELIIYPDGQKNIKLQLDKLNIKMPVKIKCRIKNFAELEILLCLISALHKNDFIISYIDFVYIFGMRSDRAFSTGMPNYFRDIIIPILLMYPNIQYRFFTPHNSNLLDGIKNFYYLNNNFMREMLDNFKAGAVLISGDESFHINKAISNTFENHYFIKTRKDTGIIDVELIRENPFDKSLKYIRCLLADQKYIPTVIADDLCDGGATFIAEAKHLKEIGFRGELYLIITHGLFTKGLDELFEYFNHIYCTNSYQDIDHPNITQLKVI